MPLDSTKVARARQVYGDDRDVSEFDLTLMTPKIYARMWPDGDQLGTIRCRTCGKSCMLKYGMCPDCYRQMIQEVHSLAGDGEQARRDAFDSVLADRFE